MGRGGVPICQRISKIYCWIKSKGCLTFSPVSNILLKVFQMGSAFICNTLVIYSIEKVPALVWSCNIELVVFHVSESVVCAHCVCVDWNRAALILSWRKHSTLFCRNWNGWVSPEVICVTFVLCVHFTLSRRPSPLPYPHPLNCSSLLVKNRVDFSQSGFK